MNDNEGFRRVLHAWAARQLEEKSDHVGPFEIVRVELDHDYGSSMDSETTSVGIDFRHDGRGCHERERAFHTGSGWEVRVRCESRHWWMPDTKQTVTMLNELLGLAEEGSEVPAATSALS